MPFSTTGLGGALDNVDVMICCYSYSSNGLCIAPALATIFLFVFTPFT
jgi:hypothetical protein